MFGTRCVNKGSNCRTEVRRVARELPCRLGQLRLTDSCFMMPDRTHTIFSKLKIHSFKLFDYRLYWIGQLRYCMHVQTLLLGFRKSIPRGNGWVLHIFPPQPLTKWKVNNYYPNTLNKYKEVVTELQFNIQRNEALQCVCLCLRYIDQNTKDFRKVNEC